MPLCPQNLTELKILAQTSGTFMEITNGFHINGRYPYISIQDIVTEIFKGV